MEELSTIMDVIDIEMSTTASVADPERLKDVLAAIRSDEGDVKRTAWLILGHVDNKPNLVDVIDSDASDDAALPDMLSKLEEDQVMYCLLRMTTTVDMSTTVKFVYIHWIGEKVAFARRGRIGVVHGSIVELINPVHVKLETGSLDELSVEALIDKLEEGSGMRNHVVESGDVSSARHYRGYAPQQNAGTPRSPRAKLTAPDGATVEIADDLKEAIAEVRQDTSETMFVVGGFEGGNLKAPLSLVAKGSGGLEEIKEALVDDQPQYVLLRTSDIIDGYNTVKFVYIYWIGENTKPILKGKVSTYAGPIEKVFSPVHVSLNFSNRYDMEEDIIKDKVMAGSGSKRNVKD